MRDLGSRKRVVICDTDKERAARTMALIAGIGMAVGVNIADMIPDPKPAKEFTDKDFELLRKAEEKRNRRRQKRLNK